MITLPVRLGMVKMWDLFVVLLKQVLYSKRKLHYNIERTSRTAALPAAKAQD